MVLADGTEPKIGMPVELAATEIKSTYWAYSLIRGEIVELRERTVAVCFDEVDREKAKLTGRSAGVVGRTYLCEYKHLIPLQEDSMLVPPSDSSLFDFLGIHLSS